MRRTRANLKILMYGLIVAASFALGLVIWISFLSRGPGASVDPPLQTTRSQRAQTYHVAYREDEAIALPLHHPTAMTVDESGWCYVAGSDIRGDHSLLAYDPRGNLRRKIQLSAACTALASAGGRVYVAFSTAIHALPSSSETLTELATLGERSLITSLAAAGDLVFAADAAQRSVWRFDSRGTLLGLIGESGFDGMAFVVPSPYFDLAVSGNGVLWIANPGKHRIERYSTDGKYQGSWTKAGSGIRGFSGCCNPSHIASMPDGSIVTAEKGVVRIKIHEPTGVFRCVVAGENAFDHRTRGMDLAVSADSRVHVVDPMRRAVRIFVPLDDGDRIARIAPSREA